MQHIKNMKNFHVTGRVMPSVLRNMCLCVWPRNVLSGLTSRKHLLQICPTQVRKRLHECSYIYKKHLLLLQIVSWLIFLACVGTSVARPQHPTSSIVDLETLEARSTGTADIIKYMLQDFNKALTSDGTPMTRVNNLVLSLMPIGRTAILEKSITEDGYDTERNLKRQEDLEKLMPAILDTLKTMMEFPVQRTSTSLEDNGDSSSNYVKSFNRG